MWLRDTLVAFRRQKEEMVMVGYGLSQETGTNKFATSMEEVLVSCDLPKDLLLTDQVEFQGDIKVSNTHEIILEYRFMEKVHLTKLAIDSLISNKS